MEWEAKNTPFNYIKRKRNWKKIQFHIMLTKILMTWLKDWFTTDQKAEDLKSSKEKYLLIVIRKGITRF